jgi:hypothetical protein
MQPPGRIDAVLRTVQALATDGRVTVSAETARKLATPLGPWINPPDPETVAKFQEVLRLAATFPVRRHPELVCNDRFSKPGIGERY